MDDTDIFGRRSFAPPAHVLPAVRAASALEDMKPMLAANIAASLAGGIIAASGRSYTPAEAVALMGDVIKAIIAEDEAASQA